MLNFVEAIPVADVTSNDAKAFIRRPHANFGDTSPVMVATVSATLAGRDSLHQTFIRFPHQFHAPAPKLSTLLFARRREIVERISKKPEICADSQEYGIVRATSHTPANGPVWADGDPLH